MRTVSKTLPLMMLVKKFMAAIQNPTPTIEVDTGPVKDVVLTGTQIDLNTLPVPTFFELDTGPFITAAVGIFRKT